MESVAIQDYLNLIPMLNRAPEKNVWLSYDESADVLYVSFSKPQDADDSEMTDDDVIVRYKNDQVVGLTVLHASKR